MKIGFMINPLAGIGGSVALKGSDGDEIVALALSRGAIPKAEVRATLALQVVEKNAGLSDDVMFYTASNTMGEDVLHSLNLPCEVLYQNNAQSTAIDTNKAIALFVNANVDLIVFAGGDGTARDVLDALLEKNSKTPVVGIPAGVKIHSAVYAISPLSAGEIINKILDGKPMTLHEVQVMDLDEQAFRDGRVSAKCYGYLTVPVDDTRMQLIKQGGVNQLELSVQDIAADLIETMEDDVYYLVGSGSTTAEIMNQLGLSNTLLGVDIVFNNELFLSDVDEQSILKTIKDKASKIVVTIIGGQGHVFGRGNQQFSEAVIRSVISQKGAQNNIIVIATNEKLHSLNKRPMIADTGNNDLDKQLEGLYSVVTGYQQLTLYKLN